MKLKKVLSLLLVIGSLVASTGLLTSQAAPVKKLGKPFKESVKNKNFKLENKFIYKKQIYNCFLKKCWAPNFPDGMYGSFKVYVDRIEKNPREYISDIAEPFGLSKEDVANDDMIKNCFMELSHEVIKENNIEFVKQFCNMIKSEDTTDREKFIRNICRLFLFKHFKSVNDANNYIQSVMKEPSKFNSDITVSLELPEDVVINDTIKDYFIKLAREAIKKTRWDVINDEYKLPWN